MSPLSLFLIGYCLLPTAGMTAADPDPVALLKAVQSAREGLYGTLKLSIFKNQVKPKTTTGTIDLELAFDGVKRRAVSRRAVFLIHPDKSGQPSNLERFKTGGNDPAVAELRGLGKTETIRERTVYDGVQLADFSEKAGAYIRVSTAGPPTYAFDARMLGLSGSTHFLETFASVLGYEPAEQVRMVGREEIDGVPVWHISVARGPGDTAHLWVEDRDGYRVHRVERDEGGDPKHRVREEARSYFPPGGRSVLPERIEIVRTAGTVRENRIVLTVEQFNPARPDPAQFGLAGLELPVGEMVTDSRVRQTLGYWDGSRLVPDLLDAVRTGEAAAAAAVEQAAADAAFRRRAYWAGGAVGLAVVAAAVWWVRRRR